MQRTIRGLRNDLGLTQKEMAEKLGVPIASYQRYERYQQVPTAKMLIKLADLCGILDLREIKYEN